MLLRLQVDGFKNLVDFDAQFGPFTCIAGENGVGKSNIFDAIEFLSLVADGPLVNAARELRSSPAEEAGEPEQLFTAGIPPGEMRFIAEMVVPSSVTDEFGERVKPTISLLRYELRVGYSQPSGSSRVARLFVEYENLSPIKVGEARKHLPFELSGPNFLKSVVFGRRTGGAFISTDAEDRRITVHQDGGSRGRPKRALPTGAQTTVVSTVNTATDPTVLAARREMQSWRRLALEPTALRRADRFSDPQKIGADGSHLAGTLHRIANSESRPDDVYARVANRVSRLAGVDIHSLRVDVDEVRQLFEIRVSFGHGIELPARALSEGTLRYLALCVMLEDPLASGVITMEEPENGIHPANVPEVVQLVQDLAVDPSLAPGVDNPVRQVIINTHSPAVINEVSKSDLLVAREVHRRFRGVTVRAIQLNPVEGSWRVGSKQIGTSRIDLMPYLRTPLMAQAELFDAS